MYISVAKLLSLSALAISSVSADWGFQDGTVSVQAKGAGVGAGLKETLSSKTSLKKPVSLGVADTLKIVLTTVDGSTPKRPHQAFLTLRDQDRGLEDSFPLSVKENGKAKLELTQKDLPFQFLSSTKPIQAKIILGSFGSAQPLLQPVFEIDVTRDSASPVTIPEPPTRYGKLSEINHIFRADPRSPSVIISGFFTLLVIGAVPVLLAAWGLLGANLGHLSKALNGAPVSHGLFFGSIVAMEGVFFLYYTTWNLFQTLPAAGLLGVVAIVSGSRALTEVQERRLAGER